MNVVRSKLPKDSRLHSYFRDGDFLDCFSMRIGRHGDPIAQIAQRIFIGLPGWINALLAVRDFGVSFFGLKTTANLPKDLSFRDSISVGDHINFLCVLSVSENEIILGEDDRHLDFRISVYRDSDASDRISLATWVHTHNTLGKIYLAAITPFHNLIVNSRGNRVASEFEVESQPSV